MSAVATIFNSFSKTFNSSTLSEFVGGRKSDSKKFGEYAKINSNLEMSSRFEDETVVAGSEVSMPTLIEVPREIGNSDVFSPRSEGPVDQRPSISTVATVKQESNNGLFTTIMFLIKSNLGTGVLGLAIATDACGARKTISKTNIRIQSKILNSIAQILQFRS